MKKAQSVAMRLAISSIEKIDEFEAYEKILGGDELDANDCRAMLTACARNGVAVDTDINELADHFFERYEFNDKVKIHLDGRLQFS